MLCPFCSPQADSITFMESNSFRVIYNHAPILPGHSLLIPKKHVESLLYLLPEQRSEMMELSLEALNLLKHVFLCTGFDLTLQEGEAAGQTIPHLHLHLIPRKTGDLPSPGDWYPNLQQPSNHTFIDSENREKLSREQVENIADYLKRIASEQKSK